MKDYQINSDNPFCFKGDCTNMKDLIILRSNLENMRDYASLGVFDNENDCLLAANKLLAPEAEIAKANQLEQCFSGLVMDYHELNQFNDDCYGNAIGWDVVNHQAVKLENGFTRIGVNYLHYKNFLEWWDNGTLINQFDVNEILATANHLEKPFSVSDFAIYKEQTHTMDLIANNKVDNQWIEVQVSLIYQLNQNNEVEAVGVTEHLL